MSNIDFHVHITPADISADWRKYARKEPYFGLLSQGKRNRFASGGDVVAALDASGFDKAVVFGFGFRDMGLCRYVNNYVIEQVRRRSSRLLGFMSLPPSKQDLEKEIDRCHDAGLAGVGELFPAGQGWDADEGEAINALAAICTERGLPVLLHVNEPVGRAYPGKTDSRFRFIEQVITRNPELTIILAHWGGGLLFYEAMPEIREQCRNVYYDTAASPLLYDYRVYRAASALGLSKKILFGSDFPLLPQSRYFAAIDESGLSAEERSCLLGGNAERLLPV